MALTPPNSQMQPQPDQPRVPPMPESVAAVLQGIQAIQPMIAPVAQPLAEMQAPRSPTLAHPSTSGAGGNRPVLDFRAQGGPGFAAGGPVPQGMAPPGGMPLARPRMPMMPPPGGAPGGPPGRGNPVDMIRQQLMQRLQSGELTPQALNTVLQMFIAAQQNPALYGKLREAVIAKKIATQRSLPMTYSPQVVGAFIQAAKSVLQSAGGAGQKPQPAPAQMANGGHIPMGASPTGDNTGRRDDIPIRVSGGEFVIPKHVVEAKGTDFFNKMLESYTTEGGKNV